MSFNPFDRAIGQTLTADDLQTLIQRHVAEGYFVEYKSTIVARDKIAKSIASLANTSGGWYIVGVETDEHNIATSICGFGVDICHDPIAVVREIVKARIDPTPVFYPQVIRLGGDLLALVVYIPPAQDGPFITTDGRLYVRQQDSSDPIFEKDRYALDRLYDRTKDLHRRVECFCQDTRLLSQHDAAQGWISLFLWPYPEGLVQLQMPGTHTWLQNLLARSQKPVRLANPLTTMGGETPVEATLPFTAAQMTPVSVLLRQVTPTEVATAGLTLELSATGSLKLHIPLPSLPNPLLDPSAWGLTQPPHPAHQQVEAAPEISMLLSELTRDARANPESTFHLLRFFNFNLLWQVVAAAISFYREVLGDQPLIPEFRLAFLISHAWRAAPYAQGRAWADHVQTFGVPVMVSDAVRHPLQAGDSLTIANTTQEEHVRLWITICSELALALGFPVDFLTRHVASMLTENHDAANETPAT